MTRIIHGDWLLPGDGAPLRDGAAVVDAEGRVLDVGPADEIVPRHAGAPREQVRGIVFPGLINAHTHVELSGLRGQVLGGRGFLDWVKSLIAIRAELAGEESTSPLEDAVAELDAAGTVAVGEVTNSLAAVEFLSRAGIGGAVFHEVFGTSRAPLMARVDGMLGQERTYADFSYAPAAHTLYTTHPDAVRAIVARAKERDTLTSLHLAEHASERRALELGDGPIPEWLSVRVSGSMDITWPKQSPFAYADSLGALGPHVLLVHLTDARPEELALVASREARVVICPRSNLYIEGRLPPLLSMRNAGLEPALGTDSLASNASLDVLAEARALADRFPSVPALELLRMATHHGALALRRPDLGRIAKGMRPGLLAVDLPDAAQSPDPAALLIRHVKAPRRWMARRA
jgi:cytosine/adenosine deaminase-related metal-dependent hydrolase